MDLGLRMLLRLQITMNAMSDQRWVEFLKQGYLRLGCVLAEAELRQLCYRIDEIMLGRAAVDYDRMLMQLDPGSGDYGDLAKQSKGFKVATLNHRKIQDLEYDPVFLEYLQRPLFRHICARAYGPETDVACFRSMFMNKPAHGGTRLRWHQDRWTFLDRDPKITIWTALDPSSVANGCVQIIPGSHHALINEESGSGFLTEEQAEAEVARADPIYLEVPAGNAVLLHNWLLHSSDCNGTDIARRAFSVCYMDAATQSTKGGIFPIVFGKSALSPDHVRRRVHR